MHEINRIRVAPESAAIYEDGWQSWSPSVSYPLHARPLRPGTENSRVMNWRQDRRPPAEVADAVVAAAVAFQHGPASDDIAVVVVRKPLSCG